MDSKVFAILKVDNHPLKKSPQSEAFKFFSFLIFMRFLATSQVPSSLLNRKGIYYLSIKDIVLFK